MQGLCVVAQAPAPARALRRAIAEKVGSVRGGTADDVGLAARCLHVLQRLQFVGIQACMDIGPGDGGVPVHVALEPLFQRLDKDITLCCFHVCSWQRRLQRLGGGLLHRQRAQTTTHGMSSGDLYGRERCGMPTPSRLA